MDSKCQFLDQISNDLLNKTRHNKKSVEKLAFSYGIVDKTEVKEFTELAIVKGARQIALSDFSIKAKYWQIVSLYQS